MKITFKKITILVDEDEVFSKIKKMICNCGYGTYIEKNGCFGSMTNNAIFGHKYMCLNIPTNGFDLILTKISQLAEDFKYDIVAII